jgi:hypothetical protein
LNCSGDSAKPRPSKSRGFTRWKKKREILPAGGGAAADAAFNKAEAAAAAAFDALEDIGDEILRARVTSAADLAVKTRVLALRDFGNGYRPEDVNRLCADVQTFAAQ